MAVTIQFRRDTATNWTSANPLLAAGEIGYETDTGNIKIGTGVAVSGLWNALSYYQLPNVSVNPVTTANLNDAAYRVMGRYRLDSVTGGSTFTNAPTDLDAADADSYCAMIVTSHAYTALSTLIQQTLTQFSSSNTALKQWVRLYDGTNWTAWTSTAHLSDSEVTTAKIADDAVTAAKLADDASTDGNRAVTTNHIRDSAVTTAKIADANVTTAKIVDDAVTAAKLADDATVDANRAVTTNHIRNGAITSGKLETNIAVSGTLSVGSTTTFSAAPSYASDPASANVLSRKSYVDSNARIGGVAVVVVQNGAIVDQSGTGFTIASNELRAPAGTTWFATLNFWQSTLTTGYVTSAMTSSSGPSVAGSLGTGAYIFICVRTS